MATLVYAGTTSHVSGIIRTPDAHPEHSPVLADAWDQMAADLAAADPDVVILIGPDHYESFGPENLPIFCIGAAEHHDAWNEHGIPGERVTGDEATGLAVHTSLVHAGFDLSLARELNLDHGYLVPVQRLGLEHRRIVPIFINCNTPPLPSMSRCLDFGVALRAAIEALPAGLRVAVLGTGGVSHWVGVRRMGEINEEWDARFLDLFTTGDLSTLASWDDASIEAEAGNGALEVRSWLMTAACAAASTAGAGGELLAYAPMHAWVTGIAIVDLAITPAAAPEGHR